MRTGGCIKGKRCVYILKTRFYNNEQVETMNKLICKNTKQLETMGIFMKLYTREHVETMK